MSILKVLKVAHDKFTWNGKRYHVWVGMVDSAGKIFGSRVWMHEQHSRSVQSLGSQRFYSKHVMLTGTRNIKIGRAHV